MSFAQDNRSMIIKRAEAFIKANIQKGGDSLTDINHLKTIELQTDISCNTEFGFIVPHGFNFNEEETVTVPAYIWIFPWTDFIETVCRKVEECPLREKDPYSLCHLLGIPEGSKQMSFAKIKIVCDGDIDTLLFRPAYQTNIKSDKMQCDKNEYRWDMKDFSRQDSTFINDNIIKNIFHYPITTRLGYTLDLDYFNTIEYIQQEELNDGTRRSKDYVGVLEYILKPNTKYTICQIYDLNQIFNIFNETILLQKQKVAVHLKYENWSIEGDFYPSQNYLKYKPGSSSPKENENEKLVALFNNARAGHKQKVCITSHIDNIERTVSREVSRVDWLTKSIYF